MGCPKKQYAAGGLMGWLFAVVFALVLARNIDITFFFVLASIGLFILIEVMNTSSARPSHIMYLRYLVAAGFVVFGAAIVDKMVRVVMS
ncbi:hypothetical protein [Methanofollis fontis]|uniref:Uncharacterized protein n=1 Tax=Methanofollis fontis TaxID=2052832 RepID=A0A483CS77_9EURY|nr:hypothetical protein [Methanofollis fontis]TAJ43935.1 hypothetical protein CUJ86_07715 [Methanofollis fontis]